MRHLLLILNPRRIPECIHALEDLDTSKAWLTGYTEHQLRAIIAELVEATSYDHYIVVSDDTTPTQAALDAVTSAMTEHEVVTGYCNLDETSPYVNLTQRPFVNTHDSTAGDYSFYTHLQAAHYPIPLIPTWFAGMSLTAMPRRLWQSVPWTTIGPPPGRSADWTLSIRLQKLGIPIAAPREAFVHHVKERWNMLDVAPEKRLLVGEIEPSVRIEA